MTSLVLPLCPFILQRNITRTFDLKGSSRARYVDLGYKVDSFDEAVTRRRLARRLGGESPPVPERVGQVLLDDNLMELTKGRPFPLKHRAKVSNCMEVYLLR